MHLQPLYEDAQITGGSGAEAHFETGLCLPSGSSMTEADQTRVIAAVRSALSFSPVIDLHDPIDVTDAQSRQHQDNPATTS